MLLPLTGRDRGHLAVALGWVRLGVGATALVRPALLLRPWVGDRHGDPGAVLLGRALGARDVALGAGAVIAFRQGNPLRWWVAAGGLADAADATATLLAFPRLPAVTRWLVLLAAAGGAAAAALVLEGTGPEGRVDRSSA
jgi:hypothetical protein